MGERMHGMMRAGRGIEEDSGWQERRSRESTKTGSSSERQGLRAGVVGGLTGFLCSSPQHAGVHAGSGREGLLHQWAVS